MARFVVDPAALRAPAADAERVAEVLAAVAAAAASIPDTGRHDSAAAAETALTCLRTALHELSQLAHGDAVVLRFAAARYSAAEQKAGGSACA